MKCAEINIIHQPLHILTTDLLTFTNTQTHSLFVIYSLNSQFQQQLKLFGGRELKCFPDQTSRKWVERRDNIIFALLFQKRHFIVAGEKGFVNTNIQICQCQTNWSETGLKQTYNLATRTSRIETSQLRIFAL